LLRKGFWFLQFETQVHQTQRRNRAQGEGQPPDKFKVVRRYPGNNHRYESSNDEAKVDLNVGEQDKPPVALAFL
jgi:hypothetical protein